MKLRQHAFAGLIAIAATGSTAAFADQTFKGLVTVVDRTTNEIVVKPNTPDAGSTTVGSTAAAPTEKFKLKDAVPETLHAGEKVTVTYTEAGGVKNASQVSEDKD